MFTFTMLNGAETVKCEISSSAVDDLAGVVSGGPAGREVQFTTVRGEIERFTSAVFDDRPNDSQSEVVRIFAKALERQRKARPFVPSPVGEPLDKRQRRAFSYFGSSPRYCFCISPSFLMRDSRVVGLIPSNSAAAFSPRMRQPLR